MSYSHASHIGRHLRRLRLPNRRLHCTARRRSSLDPARPRARLFVGNTTPTHKYQEWLRRKRVGK